MIYFIRHGETEFNQKGISQGQLDIDINEVGIAQANDAAKKLEKLKIDKIFCSPLIRAKHTAEIINNTHKAPVEFDDRLKERKLGSRENTIFENWTEQQKKEFFAHPEHFGAETDIDFFERVKDFYDEIKSTHKNILIVSHGGVYRNIVRIVTNNLDFSKKIDSIKNCVLVSFD